MTRLEYYSRHLVALIIFFILGLITLILWTIISDTPKAQTKNPQRWCPKQQFSFLLF